MFRRIVICLPLTVFLLTVSSADAQQSTKIPRDRFPGCKHCFWQRGPLGSVPGQELRKLGWLEGKNMAIEYRSAEGEKMTVCLSLRRTWSVLRLI